MCVRYTRQERVKTLNSTNRDRFCKNQSISVNASKYHRRKTEWNNKEKFGSVNKQDRSVNRIFDTVN